MTPSRLRCARASASAPSRAAGGSMDRRSIRAPPLIGEYTFGRVHSQADHKGWRKSICLLEKCRLTIWACGAETICKTESVCNLRLTRPAVPADDASPPDPSGSVHPMAPANFSPGKTAIEFVHAALGV